MMKFNIRTTHEQAMLKRLRQRNPGIPLPRILYYEFLRNILRVTMSTFLGLRVKDSKNLPESGPVVVVANHQSVLDPPLMGAALPRHFFMLARSSLFNNPIFETLIRSVNAIPVRGDQKDTAVFKDCGEHLKQGRIVALYPEGSRTSDGGVDEFKRGAMLLIRRSKATVVPLAIEGAYDNWPRDAKRPHLRGPIHLKFGKPIPSEVILALPPNDALALLRDQVDTLRLELRAKIRLETQGKFPPPSPADYHHLDPRSKSSNSTDT